MKVFLAGIIQGSIAEADIHDQSWREDIRDLLARCLGEAEVYCHYSEHPESITYDMADIRGTFRDGVRRAHESDLLIAYLPSASMGTAIEMYEAHRHGAVVLTITPMSANWVVRLYSDRIFPDVESFGQFLAGDGLTRLFEAKGKP